MSLAVIFEFATFIAFAVVLLGGVQQRSYGWKMVCALIGLASVAQAVGMSIIVRTTQRKDYILPCRISNMPRLTCTIMTNASSRDGSSTLVVQS